MKKVPYVLLCFLFIGPSPSGEELTIVLTSRATYSGVSLLRLEGDTLVSIFNGDTLMTPVGEVSEISTRSLVLGFPGCLFGLGVGAVAGAACAAAIDPIEGPGGGEMKGSAQVGCGALLGSGVGALGGCIIFPENQERYVLEHMTPEQKKSALASILSRRGHRTD